MARITATSPTPNPDARKYTVDVSFDGMTNVTDPADAETPFVAAIFAAPGVAGVFATSDFLTVTRRPDADWTVIEAAVEQAVADHL
jgi:hypothetical protein